MIIRNRSLYISALALDTLLLASLFILAAVIAQPMTLLFTSHRHMFFLLVAEIAVWYFISDSVGLYEHIGSRLYATHAIRLSKAVIAQAVMAVFFVFTVKETLYTRNFIGLYSISLFVFITMRSLAFRKYFKRSQRKNINLRNLLIIGSGQTAAHFYRTVSASPSFGYGKVVMLGDFPCELEVYRGGLNLIEDVVAENKFEEAVIAFEEDEGNKIKRIIQICNKYALHTYLIPDYYKFLSRRFEVAMISNFPILSLRREPLEEIDWQILKRGFDILCSLIIIITVLSWLFPIIICLQKILSPGPVFYLQDRVGKNKVKFRCIKFRSMKYSSVNDQFKPAEENDVRITKWGNFLRKSNIDEFPQIINVLIGQMSLVGPRPHAVAYDEVYKDFIEEIRLRNLIKPGITGWAQIHGLRGDVADEEENKKRIRKRIEYDIWYMENWSFLLDIQIIFITIWQMVSGSKRGIIH